MYWNEVLKPQTKLDPKFVKALIDSESSFDPSSGKNNKSKNKAMGLMQLRNQARQILADEKGKIKDHYITITNDQLYDANVNICAGIRWLFHKQELSSRNSKVPLTWTDAVVKYKGLDLSKKRDVEVFEIFKTKLKKYSK